jgi:hypothetical protein
MGSLKDILESLPGERIANVGPVRHQLPQAFKSVSDLVHMLLCVGVVKEACIKSCKNKRGKSFSERKSLAKVIVVAWCEYRDEEIHEGMSVNMTERDGRKGIRVVCQWNGLCYVRMELRKNGMVGKMGFWEGKKKKGIVRELEVIDWGKTTRFSLNRLFFPNLRIGISRCICMLFLSPLFSYYVKKTA